MFSELEIRFEVPDCLFRIFVRPARVDRIKVVSILWYAVGSVLKILLIYDSLPSIFRGGDGVKLVIISELISINSFQVRI